MPVSIEEVRQFLDSKSLKYLYDFEKETFVITFSPHVIMLRLEESGEFLQLRTLNFGQYKSGKNRENILEMIATLNYRRKLVKFGYDAGDGEINCCIDIPVEDSSFSCQQFYRCLAAMLEALEEAHSRLVNILETGKDPGPPKQKMIDSLVNEIMDSINEEPMPDAGPEPDPEEPKED